MSVSVESVNVNWTVVAAIAGVIGLVLSQALLFVRVSNTIAVNARRLDEVVEWKTSKGVERQELEAARSALRAELHEQAGKLGAVETEVRKLTDTLLSLRLDVAKIPERLERQDEVQLLRHDALKHTMNNLKQMIQSLGERIGRPPRPPQPAAAEERVP